MSELYSPYIKHLGKLIEQNKDVKKNLSWFCIRLPKEFIVSAQKGCIMLQLQNPGL